MDYPKIKYRLAQLNFEAWFDRDTLLDASSNGDFDHESRVLYQCWFNLCSLLDVENPGHDEYPEIDAKLLAKATKLDEEAYKGDYTLMVETWLKTNHPDDMHLMYALWQPDEPGYLHVGVVNLGWVYINGSLIVVKDFLEDSLRLVRRALDEIEEIYGDLDPEQELRLNCIADVESQQPLRVGLSLAEFREGPGMKIAMNRMAQRAGV